MQNMLVKINWMWYVNRLIYLLCISSSIQAQGIINEIPDCYICGTCDYCPQPPSTQPPPPLTTRPPPPPTTRPPPPPTTRRPPPPTTRPPPPPTTRRPPPPTTRPPPPPVWTEPHCMDSVGGKKLVSIPVRYYRRNKIQAADKRKCLEYCTAQSGCDGVEWYSNTCYDIYTTYETGRVPTQGTIKFKANSCFTISSSSPLKRLKRTWTAGLFHKWNAENTENSGICMLASNNVQGCTSIVRVGSHENDRKLQLNGANFAGYCMQTPGDCGATELVKRYYRYKAPGPDWHYTILKADFERIDQINANFRYEDVLCYVWPGYPDINCVV